MKFLYVVPGVHNPYSVVLCGKDLHALRDNTSPIIRPKSPGAFFFLGARSVVIEQLLHRVKIHSLKKYSLYHHHFLY